VSFVLLPLCPVAVRSSARHPAAKQKAAPEGRGMRAPRDSGVAAWLVVEPSAFVVACTYPFKERAT